MSVNLALIVNGVECNTIKYREGVKQDDPLSPYLLVFVVDGLKEKKISKS